MTTSRPGPDAPSARPSPLTIVAERAEEVADVGDQALGLLHRGELATSLVLTPRCRDTVGRPNRAPAARRRAGARRRWARAYGPGGSDGAAISQYRPADDAPKSVNQQAETMSRTPV